MVHELQGEPVDRRLEPEVSSSLPAFVPDEYVEDRDEKLDVYRRMAALSTTPDLEALRSELRDRFGPMPDEVEHLLALKGLRVLGKEAGAERLKVGKDRLEIDLHEPLPRDRIVALVAATPMPIEFASGARTLRIRKPDDPVLLATKVLRALAPADSVARLPLTAAGS